MRIACSVPRGRGCSNAPLLPGDADSNRCGINATTCSAAFAYNAADEATASPGVASYAYSYRGDVTGIGTGASIGYDANDHVTGTVDATGATATVVLDEVAPSGRVLQTSSAPQGSVATADTFFGYASGSDSPSYTESGALGILGLTLLAAGPPTDYLTGPGGLLALDATGVSGVTATYPIADAHGDIVGTTDASGAFTANPSTDAWGVGSAPAANLGWLGNDERYTTGASLDLIQMGVRLYDPALGRFLEPDPVPGGSANAYDYANQDPVNSIDLDGTCSKHHGVFGWVRDRACKVGDYVSQVRILNVIVNGVSTAITIGCKDEDAACSTFLALAQWATGHLNPAILVSDAAGLIAGFGCQAIATIGTVGVATAPATIFCGALGAAVATISQPFVEHTLKE